MDYRISMHNVVYGVVVGCIALLFFSLFVL